MAEDITLDTLLCSEESFPGDVSPKNYNYYNGLKTGHLYMTDEIDENIIDTIGIPLLNMMEDDEIENINIYINTPGGSVCDAFWIADVIETSNKPITITCLGTALSMGVIMLMAGKDNPNVIRKCYPHSYGLIHAGSFGYSGDINGMNDASAFVNMIEKQNSAYIVSHTTIPSGTLKKKRREDWYINAEEMLKYGIVDEIIGRKDEQVGD